MITLCLLRSFFKIYGIIFTERYSVLFKDTQECTQSKHRVNIYYSHSKYTE